MGADRAPAPEQAAHRSRLEEQCYAAGAAFDRAVMALSGGGLAVSFAFLRGVITPEGAVQARGCLLAGWFGLAASLAAVLVSILTGQWSLRKAMLQIDRGNGGGERLGGRATLWTTALNWVAAGVSSSASP